MLNAFGNRVKLSFLYTILVNELFASELEFESKSLKVSDSLLNEEKFPSVKFD